MTLLEFNQLTKANLTEDDYKSVELMYLDSGNMDKAEFCTEWVKHKDSKLLQIFYNQSCKLRDKKDNLKDQIWDLAEFMLDQAMILNSDTLDQKVKDLIGINRYLMLKLEKDYHLNSDDRNEMIKLICKY